MRTIIAGSRGIEIRINDLGKVIKDSGFTITEVISGTARGVDQSGERWAEVNGIPIRYFVPDWNRYGKSAGYKRNVLMAENADALIAIWDGVSKGTGHMIQIAKSKNLKVHVSLTAPPVKALVSSLSKILTKRI